MLVVYKRIYSEKVICTQNLFGGIQGQETALRQTHKIDDQCNSTFFLPVNHVVRHHRTKYYLRREFEEITEARNEALTRVHDH